MISLGIESTAHTLSIGISNDGKILSNVIDRYKAGGEGLIPRKMADHHANVFSEVLFRSLEEAGIRMEDVDIISFSQGPGIGSPLALGTSAAKYLALRFGKEIIGVNHCYAHVKIGELATGLEDPLVLYLSGGNSQIIEKYDDYYKVLGETLDLGMGNMFDSFARSIGLGEAHGAELEKLARTGKYVRLPYSVKGMNLVFSGLETMAEKLIGKETNENLAHSIMETAFSMTCEVTERALFLSKKKNLLVCGGVAQNRRLQEMLTIMCRDAGAGLGIVPDEYNQDNGAMIAYAGEILSEKFGTRPASKWKHITNYRIDRMKNVFNND